MARQDGRSLTQPQGVPTLTVQLKCLADTKKRLKPSVSWVATVTMRSFSRRHHILNKIRKVKQMLIFFSKAQASLKDTCKNIYFFDIVEQITNENSLRDV